jgi:hypothetical protein
MEVFAVSLSSTYALLYARLPSVVLTVEFQLTVDSLQADAA